jgi:hypothetical protein
MRNFEHISEKITYIGYPRNAGNFLSSLGHISFSGMPLLHGVRPAECALYKRLFLKTK